MYIFKGVLSLSPDALKVSGAVPSSFAESHLGQHIKSINIYKKVIRVLNFNLTRKKFTSRSEIFVFQIFASKIIQIKFEF